MIHASLENIRDLLNSSTPVLLVFHSAWCSGCAAEQKVLHALDEDPEWKTETALVNADREEAINTLFRVSSLPAFFLLQKGKVLAYRSGFQSAEQLKQMTEQ